MSDNPYQAPQDPHQEFAAMQPAAFVDPGYVFQVTFVCIFMLIQGALSIFVAIYYMVIFPLMMHAIGEAPSGQQPPPEMKWVFVGLAALMGIPPLVSGMLQVFAGIKNLWFRGRVLGIIALVSNVGTLITCYCAPTAIALMIFGLIVYLNQQVAEAFRMGQAGATRGEVLLAFTPYYGPAPPK